MAKGRKPIEQDQVQGLCLKCHINKQMPGPRSKLGYKKYIKICSSCAKLKYGDFTKSFRKKKKPHCERCGFLAEDPCQLDIHHKDRNSKNHKDDNLITLCSNCHRLEHKEERKIWGSLSTE